MIEAPVRNVAGEVVRQIQLDERVFGITPNTAVVHQAVVAQLANQRRGTHSTKSRGEVAGGGKKPWRQKGTGRARQGSTRAPHWRGGGIVFGPKPRSYHQDLPRKMRRLAMRSALSAKLRDGELMVLDGFTLPTAKTREMAATLAQLGAADGALIVLGGPDPEVKRAAANLPKVRTVAPGSTNLLDVLNHRWLLLTVDAVETLTRALTAGVRPLATTEGEAAAPARRARRGARAASAPSASTAAAPRAEVEDEGEAPGAAPPARRRRPAAAADATEETSDAE